MDVQSKVESFLINLDITFEQIEGSGWVVNDEEKGLESVAIISAEPLVVFRVNVMDIPDKNREEFYKTLLELNATELVHGAYAIENDEVLLVDSLEYGTMDIEEFQASLDAIGLALAQHYELLSSYRKSQ